MLKELKHECSPNGHPSSQSPSGCQNWLQTPRQLQQDLAQEYPPRPPLPNLLCAISSPDTVLPTLFFGHSLLAPLLFFSHSFSGLKRLIFHLSWTMHAHFLHARDRTDSDIV